MRTSTAVMIASVFSLAACVPPENLSTVDAPVLDRFESESYAADASNNENLQGLWIMTTKNYDTVVSNTQSETGDVTTTELSGSLRMACMIVQLDNGYSSSCYGTGSLYLSGSELANESHSWVATVVDNAHMTGTFSSVYEMSGNGVDTNLTTSLDFEMVKINAVNAVIGSMALTVGDVVESSDVNEFYETEMQQVITSNGVLVSTDQQSAFSAFGNDGNLFGFYSQINGLGLMANTISLNVDVDSGENTALVNAVNTASEISMEIRGVDNNNASFVSTLDITL